MIYFQNPRLQASIHIMCLYSSACVRPGRKPGSQVFSQRGSFYLWLLSCTFFSFCKNVSCVVDTIEGNANRQYRAIFYSLKYICMARHNFYFTNIIEPQSLTAKWRMRLAP